MKKNSLFIRNYFKLAGMVWSDLRCFARSRVSAMPPLMNRSDAVICSPECGSQTDYHTSRTRVLTLEFLCKGTIAGNCFLFFVITEVSKGIGIVQVYLTPVQSCIIAS